MDEPKKVNKLLTSIQYFYPDLKCLVGIQTDRNIDEMLTDYNKYNNVSYLIQSYDIGLSAARNELASMVKSKYTLLLEDDFIVYEQTKIESMYDLLETNQNIDLVAGRLYQNNIVKDYQRLVYTRKDTIVLLDWNKAKEMKLVDYISQSDITYGECDIVYNFFMIRSNVLVKNLWNPEHKIHSEHLDFMLNLKKHNKCVVFIPAVIIRHEPYKSETIKPLRYRQYYNLIYRDYNIRKGWCVGEKAILDYEHNTKVNINE